MKEGAANNEAETRDMFKSKPYGGGANYHTII